MGPEASDALAALDTSSLVFYLAGSRYMGCARLDSDWDFYVQNSDGVIAFLFEKGFSPMSKGYEGSNGGHTVVVMEKKEEGRTVQVQVLRDVHLLRRVRDIIRVHLLEEHIKADKEARRFLWTTLATALAFKAADYNDLAF